MKKLVFQLLLVFFTSTYAQDGKAENTNSKKSVVTQNIVQTTEDVSQQQNKSIEDSNIYSLPQKKAEFEGGLTDLSLFFLKNIQYSAEMKQNKIKGRVYCSFVVEKNGSVSDIKVIRGLGSGSEAEAERVLKSMPNWTSAQQANIKVRSSQLVALEFDANGK